MMQNLSIRRSQPSSFRSSGQALLIILLIMAVVLTVALSLISRSITDVQISQQTEETARAFSAAEAGIEEALTTGVGNSAQIPGTQEKYSVAVTGLSEGQTFFVFPQPVATNDIQTLWLAKNQSNGSLTQYYNRDKLRVLWGNPGTDPRTSQTPALEVLLYYLDAIGNYKVARVTLDPNDLRSPDSYFCKPNTSCQDVDSFITSGWSAGGQNFQFTAVLNLSGLGFNTTLLLARLRLFYSTNTSHFLGAAAEGSGTNNFPSQGTKIDSSGSAGSSTRKVEVIRYYVSPPDIFDFALFSEGSLVHQ